MLHPLLFIIKRQEGAYRKMAKRVKFMCVDYMVGDKEDYEHYDEMIKDLLSSLNITENCDASLSIEDYRFFNDVLFGKLRDTIKNKIIELLNIVLGIKNRLNTPDDLFSSSGDGIIMDKYNEQVNIKNIRQLILDCEYLTELYNLKDHKDILDASYNNITKQDIKHSKRKQVYVGKQLNIDISFKNDNNPFPSGHIIKIIKTQVVEWAYLLYRKSDGIDKNEISMDSLNRLVEIWLPQYKPETNKCKKLISLRDATHLRSKIAKRHIQTYVVQRIDDLESFMNRLNSVGLTYDIHFGYAGYQYIDYISRSNILYIVSKYDIDTAGL